MAAVFRRKNTHDPDVADFLQSVEREDFVSAQSLTVDLAASTADQEFPHGLQRAYRGAVVVGQSAPVVVFVGLPTASSDPSKRIVLSLSAATACRAELRVF